MQTSTTNRRFNAADPFRYKTRIVGRCHATPVVSAAREQKLTGLLARHSQVPFDRLPGLFSQLELDRSSRLPLPHRRTLNRVARRRHVLDLEGYDVTATKLAIDCQIEHRAVSAATLNHQSCPDRPDVLWPQWGLAPISLPLFHGVRVGSFGRKARFSHMVVLLGY